MRWWQNGLMLLLFFVSFVVTILRLWSGWGEWRTWFHPRKYEPGDEDEPPPDP